MVFICSVYKSKSHYTCMLAAIVAFVFWGKARGLKPGYSTTSFFTKPAFSVSLTRTM